MRGYRLSFEARRDLDEIWAYSRGRWGSRRASTYIREIQTAVATIVQRPDLGQGEDHLNIQYRKRPVGSHVIFYRLSDGPVEIVRVLHQNMDVDSHLP